MPAPVTELRVDGGACVNDLLMQFQADLLGIPVVRPQVIETTALGAAYLAGLGCGVYRGLDELARAMAGGAPLPPDAAARARGRADGTLGARGAADGGGLTARRVAASIGRTRARLGTLAPGSGAESSSRSQASEASQTDDDEALDIEAAHGG